MTPAEMAALHAAAFTMSRPWSESEFATLCAESTTRVFTASHAFVLWGVIAQEAELLTIAVSPQLQGQGIGAGLMARAMAELASAADTAFLEVAADNAPAIALYQRCGFTQVGTRRAYYARSTGARIDALVLRAPLDATDRC